LSVTYRKAIEADIADLAPQMREQDRREIYSSHGVTPLEGLTLSFAQSEDCKTIEDQDGRIVGMFGVVDKGDSEGSPWLLGSEDLPKINHQSSFLSQSKDCFADMKLRYRKLDNHVHAENWVSIRWLKWLGFSFDKEITWGYHPSKFIKFYWNKEGEAYVFPKRSR